MFLAEKKTCAPRVVSREEFEAAQAAKSDSDLEEE